MDFEKIISKERIHKNEPMKKYTSFKIGGNAETLINIKTIDEVKKVLNEAQN